MSKHWRKRGPKDWASIPFDQPHCADNNTTYIQYEKQKHDCCSSSVDSPVRRWRRGRRGQGSDSASQPTHIHTLIHLLVHYFEQCEQATINHRHVDSVCGSTDRIVGSWFFTDSNWFMWPNLSYKLRAVAVWMTVTCHTVHPVVSRHPANLASRQKCTSDRIWRDNEVRLY